MVFVMSKTTTVLVCMTTTIVVNDENVSLMVMW